MKRLLWLGLLVACQDLPPVDGHDYACTAEVFDDGSFQCLPSDYCAQNACVSRLNCQTEGQAGCRAESTRCELSITPERAAVSCQPGVHTATSTPVPTGPSVVTAMTAVTWSPVSPGGWRPTAAVLMSSSWQVPFAEHPGK